MTTIDCTLDALKIPALPTYTNEFGTKKSSGGLSTAECSDAVMLPFRKMRPYEVSETSTTTDIQHNAVFVMKTAGITLTLHDCSTDFLGCEARVINVSSGDVTVKGDTSGLDGGTDGVTIPSKREARFIFLSDGWHSSYAEYLNVTDKELASSSVTTAKIADNAVTNDKIAGTIPIAKGGTGATTALGAEYNILGSVGTEETTPSDTSYLALRNQTLSSTNGTFRWTKCANIWTWIQSKISSVLGLTASSYNGNSVNVTQRKSLSDVSHADFPNNQAYLPDMSFMARWNGAYNSSGSSNLTCCSQGTIIGSSNIGSQSVSYATSAGNASTVNSISFGVVS